jgi:hypothetical protein
MSENNDVLLTINAADTKRAKRGGSKIAHREILPQTKFVFNQNSKESKSEQRRRNKIENKRIREYNRRTRAAAAVLQREAAAGRAEDARVRAQNRRTLVNNAPSKVVILVSL